MTRQSARRVRAKKASFVTATSPRECASGPVSTYSKAKIDSHYYYYYCVCNTACSSSSSTPAPWNVPSKPSYGSTSSSTSSSSSSSGIPLPLFASFVCTRAVDALPNRPEANACPPLQHASLLSLVLWCAFVCGVRHNQLDITVARRLGPLQPAQQIQESENINGKREILK